MVECLKLVSWFGGIAQLARASALQAEGHRFDSDYLHHLNQLCEYSTTVSATAFQAEDVSSILITRSILRCVAVVASQSHKLKVVGSSPTIRNQVSKDFKNKHLSKKQ